MALAPGVVTLLNDLEKALEAVLASDAIAAVEAEVNSLLPASVAPYVATVEAATLSAAQAGLASLLSKIPVVS